MKRLALAVGLVFAFSSAAFAINFTGNSITIEGYNTWSTNAAGKLALTSAQKDSRTLKLSSSGTGWKATAEFLQNSTDTNGSMPAIALDDLYFTTTEKPFKLEIWNWAEDPNADYATPFSWVNETDDAPAKNWEARVTTTVAGNETVFAIENDTAAPIYYLFGKKAFGTTTAGLAYRTKFTYDNTFDAWATAVVNDVTLTGEVATYQLNSTTRKNAVGVKASLKSGLALQAYVNDNPNNVKYFEAIQTPTDVLSRYLGSYKVEGNGTKATTTADVRFRASNDQAIADIWNAVDTVWDVNDFADNDWLKNKVWAAGVNLVNVKETAKVTTNTLNLYATYVPAVNTNVFGNVKVVKGSTTLTNGVVRAYWKSQDPKLSVHPRVFFNTNNLKVGSYAIYSINQGQLALGAFKTFDKNTKALAKPVTSLEAGYQITF